MDKKIKFTIKYISILLIIAILLAAVFTLIGYLSSRYTNRIDEIYKEKSKSEKFAFPSIFGNAQGLDYIYTIKDIDEKKLVILGASTSMIGMENGQGVELLKACSGSATIYSMKVMKSYLTDIGVCICDDDIVKLDISAVLFKKTKTSDDVLASALEYGKIYDVDEDGNVKKGFLFSLKKLFALNARKIQKAIEYISEYIKNGSYDELFKVSTNTYEGYDKLISIDEDRIEALLAFISSFDNKKFVVDILYESEVFKNSKAGILFNDFADNILIPYLNEHGISYIDSRDLLLDEIYYLDNTHLNYDGRLKYTDFVNEELKNIFGE